MTWAVVWELQEMRELGPEQGQAGWERLAGRVGLRHGGLRGVLCVGNHEGGGGVVGWSHVLEGSLFS